jgi:N-acetylglucosamine kinase-like BadF-type ATPase
MEYVLGIDGGGTKTAAVILTTDGEIFGFGEAGASTYGVVPLEDTQNHIAEAVDRARQRAGISAFPFQAVFLGLGNVVSEADRRAIRQIAQGLNLAEVDKIGVDHDIRVALAGGLSGKPGIALILGTGASCFGLNTGGKTWRSGGWGPVIDDGGSGYWLGIQAMHAAVAAYDGRGAATQLTSLVMETLELETMDGLMNRLYVQNLSRSEIGNLGKLVFSAAQHDDEIAIRIIQQGCDLLAECVFAVTRKLEMDASQCEVALVGGLTRAGPVYLDPLIKAIGSRLPGCNVHLAEMPPVLGAGLLALQILHPTLPGSIFQKIREESKHYSSIDQVESIVIL